MSERYSRLFTLPDDLYATGSPVVIAAGALLKDNQTENVLAQMKFRSVSPKLIKAIKVSVLSMDTVGRTLGEAKEHQYLDLSASRGAEFGQKTAIPLADASTRSFSVAVTEVAFADNSIWASSADNWQQLPVLPPLMAEARDEELVKQYQLTYGKQCRFSPLAHEDLWFCSCGAVNRAEESTCHDCNLEYAKLNAVQWAALKKACDERLAAEKAWAEQQAAEQAKREALRREEEARQAEIAAVKAKKRNKVLAICAVLAVVACAAAYVLTQIVIPEQKNKAAYESAMAAYSAGDYADAIAKFTVLGDYNDSAAKVLEAKYSLACAAFDAEKYEEAKAQFLELGDYQDSAQRVADSEAALETHTAYLEAIAAFDKGDYGTAIRVFEKLGGYKNSTELLENAWAAKKEATYNNALAALAAGEYSNAKNLFQSLNGYKDSVAKIEEASAALLESTYKDAVSLYLKKDYKAAYQKFVSLEDYKDSAERRLACIKTSLRSAKVGGTAVVGSTEWKVLQCKNNTYTLITSSEQNYSNFAENFLKSRNDAEKALITKGPYLPSRQDVKTYSLTTYRGVNTSMMLSDGWLWLGNVINEPHGVGFQPLSYFMLQIKIAD